MIGTAEPSAEKSGQQRGKNEGVGQGLAHSVEPARSEILANDRPDGGRQREQRAECDRDDAIHDRDPGDRRLAVL